MSEADLDTRVRAQAFQFLTEKTRLYGEVVQRDLLERGFDFEGRRVPLIGPQGIFKPALLADMPISITTVPVKEGEARPYDDGVGRTASCATATAARTPPTATIRDCASRWGAGLPSSTYVG